MRRQRKIILALVLLLAIGFAAVSATLLINGNAKIGTNDFDVYFSSASIDGVENNALISQDGKSITYETANLQVAGDVSKLDYTITNNSSQYDAEVKIECDFSGNEYVTLENSLQNDVIEAKTEKEGTLTATLIKTSTEERSQSFTCTVVASAVERETAGEDVVVEGESSTYSLYGTLTDESGAALANQVVVAYSDPVYTTTDENGYFYMEGIEKGSHTLYVMGEVSIDDVKALSEEEVATQATTKGNFTTNTVNIAFENGYTLEDEVVEKTQTYTIILDANGGSLETTTYEVTKGNYYPEISIPTISDTKKAFAGWKDVEGNIIELSGVVELTSGLSLTAEYRCAEGEVCVISGTGSTVGDELAIGTSTTEERFYVIASDTTNITLLSKFNIKTDTLLQADVAYGETATAFSSSAYWSADFTSNPYDLVETGEPSSDHYAAYYAYKYGEKLGVTTGRLMYHSEANTLRTTIPDIIYGRDSTANTNSSGLGYLMYWLGSALNTSDVWHVNGNYSILGNRPFSNSSNYGVRPVITISADLI